MRLVDPQSMETLPEEGVVFWEYVYTNSNGAHRKIITRSARVVKSLLRHSTYVGTAWSYTATTKDEGQ